MDNWLRKVEHKYRRYAISNLMTHIVIGMGIVYFMSIMSPVGLSRYLFFDSAAIMRGEVWRLLTFAVIPPPAGGLFIALALYFYWMLGSALENTWGSFKFNIFYLFGILGNIIAGFITGFATNDYLNLSLLFAFAMLYPNFQILLFFIIPLKIKYLALLNAVFFVHRFIFTPWWPIRVAIAVSLLNVALFFGRDFINGIRQTSRRQEWKKHFK